VDYFLSEDRIFLLRWFDNKEVMVGSNHYGAEPMSMVRRWDKTKKVYVYIRIPTLIKAYNKGMGGVDHCDQLLSFYRYTTYLRYIFKYDTGNVQYIYGMVLYT
jgi:hypothetical protein